MRRFSDRLTSTSATMIADNGSSDERAIKSSSPTDQEYIALVEVIGLHQTVKILEAEYCLIVRDGKPNKDLEVKLGYSIFQCSLALIVELSQLMAC